jgi:hypothetical protein
LQAKQKIETFEKPKKAPNNTLVPALPWLSMIPLQYSRFKKMERGTPPQRHSSPHFVLQLLQLQHPAVAFKTTADATAEAREIHQNAT